MALNSDHDAELHWLVVMFPTPSKTWPMIVGVVRNDKKGRIANGRTIQTSTLLTPVEEIQVGALVHTLNSCYLLVGANVERN